MSTPNIEPVYVYLGNRIKHLREMAGITQSELGKAIGCTRANIANIEAGTNRVMLHDLGALADALKVKTDALLNGIWNKKLDMEGGEACPIPNR